MVVRTYERPCDTAGGTEAGGSQKWLAGRGYVASKINEVERCFDLTSTTPRFNHCVVSEPTTMLVPVLHKTLSTLVIASALSSNVLLAALPTTSASAAGGCGKSKIYGDYMGTIFILKFLDLVHTSEYT